MLTRRLLADMRRRFRNRDAGGFALTVAPFHGDRAARPAARRLLLIVVDGELVGHAAEDETQSWQRLDAVIIRDALSSLLLIAPTSNLAIISRFPGQHAYEEMIPPEELHVVGDEAGGPQHLE